MRWLRKLLGIRSPSREMVEGFERGRDHAALGDHDRQNCDICKGLAEVDAWLMTEMIAMRDQYIREALGEPAEDQEDRQERISEATEGGTGSQESD